MAARHWVWLSQSWDATASTKRALTQNWAGGQAVPTSADDVYIDQTNGGASVVCTVANGYTASCLSLTVGSWVLNHNITLAAGNSIIQIYAWGLTVNSNAYTFFSMTTGTLTMKASSHFNTHWVALNTPISIAWAYTLTLDSNLNIWTGNTANLSGTTNGYTVAMWWYTVTAYGFMYDTVTKTLTTSAWGILNIYNTMFASTGTTTWTGSNNATVNIWLTAWYQHWFYTGVAAGFTLLAVTIGTAAKTYIYGSNTITTLTIAWWTIVEFIAGKTQSITTLTINSSSGNDVAIWSATASLTTLNIVGAGTISYDYLSLYYIKVQWAGTTRNNGTHCLDDWAHSTWRANAFNLDRYFYGVNWTWGSTAGWTCYSWGTYFWMGYAAPTTTNDVYCDATAWAAILTVAWAITPKSLTFTGFTWTFSAGAYTIWLYWNLILWFAMTRTSTWAITFNTNSATFDTGNKIITNAVIFAPAATLTNGGTIYCKSLSFSAAATYADGGNPMTLAGSLSLFAWMTWSWTGTVLFTAAATLTTAGISMATSPIQFNAAAIFTLTWNLLAKSLYIQNCTTFSAGAYTIWLYWNLQIWTLTTRTSTWAITFNTNSATMTLAWITIPNIVYVSIWSNTFTLPNNTACWWLIFQTNCIFSAAAYTLSLTGNLTLFAWMTRTSTGDIQFNTNSATLTWATILPIQNNILINVWLSKILTIVGNLETSWDIYRVWVWKISRGSYTVLCNSFWAGNFSKEIIMSSASSILDCTSYDPWTNFVTNNLAFGSKIKCTWNFHGRWNIYRNLELNWASQTIYDDNVFDDLKIWKDWAQTIIFYTDSTQDITTFTCIWAPGKIKTLKWFMSMVVWNIVSAGLTQNCDYIDVTNSQASGAAFNAWQNSIQGWWNHWRTFKPVTDFSGTPLNGLNPLSVAFTDLSTNIPTIRDRDRWDGSIHGTTQNPSHIYSSVWVYAYTVKLTASNDSWFDDEIKVGYVTIKKWQILFSWS